LQKLSLVYLRAGDKVSFDATPEHKQLVEATISELAFRLRTDDMWEATTGEHCDRCTYARYCGAVQEKPEPLPENAKSSRQMQLVLSI
jgi:putative RecB family exonuclease